MNPHNTDDIVFSTQEPPRTEEQATRFIDVHIYDLDPHGQEPPIVESEPQAEPAATGDHDEEPPAPPQEPRRRRVVLPLAGLLALALLSVLAVVVVLPVLTPPEASVTIVPVSTQITTTSTLTVTTGQATNSTQIPGRVLAALTMNQARTVPTTGKAHQDARPAHGSITFYNAATYPQTVAAGTLLTGADGVEALTDTDAVLPAGTLATNGQATVPAHALSVGPGGNIQAGDIYGTCCRANVLAANTAFTGGQAARDYPTVTPQDITVVVKRLKTSLDQSVQAALQTQVHNDETLMTPLPCQQNVKPDRQPGEEAVQITVTISETCRGMAYSTQTYHDRLTQLAQVQATKQLGDGYAPIGQVQGSIVQTTTPNQIRAGLRVTIAQGYAYQLSVQQQQQIKTLIAGKSKAQATTTLLHVPGIQSVSVSSATIPTDIQHIHVIVVYVG